jgi:hypothetical protein
MVFSEHDGVLFLCCFRSHQEMLRTTFLQEVFALLIPCGLIDGSTT